MEDQLHAGPTSGRRWRAFPRPRLRSFPRVARVARLLRGRSAPADVFPLLLLQSRLSRRGKRSPLLEKLSSECAHATLASLRSISPIGSLRKNIRSRAHWVNDRRFSQSVSQANTRARGRTFSFRSASWNRLTTGCLSDQNRSRRRSRVYVKLPRLPLADEGENVRRSQRETTHTISSNAEARLNVWWTTSCPVRQ